MKKITSDILSACIKKRPSLSYKGDYGRILLVGGEAQMGGAIIMAASACVHAGAGLVTVATDISNKTALFSRLPEAMWCDLFNPYDLVPQIEEAEVIIVGPGLGQTVESCETLKLVLDHCRPHHQLIIDGDGLSLLAKENLALPSCQVILTPHPGEWRALSGLAVDEQTPAENRKKQEELAAVLVLKGERTVVYFDEESFENTTGTPAQATGGMGDTLAGMIGAFVGQFDDKKTAVLAAVYLHSYIAEEIAQDSYVSLPTAVIERIPQTMKRFES